MEKVYLYLARRNNRDTKIVGTLKSSAYVHPTMIKDITILGLPADKLQTLQDVLDKHKFEWDLWLESADNYKLLKENLQVRGIIASSSSNAPFIDLESHEIPKTTLIKLAKNKIMTRRMN